MVNFYSAHPRELLDETHEEVISHELFHQWFGDLVTPESWSNIPLNESFATYGEYLWNEYKYGREYADFKFRDDYRQYTTEAKSKTLTLSGFITMTRKTCLIAIVMLKVARYYIISEKQWVMRLSLSRWNCILKPTSLKSVEIANLRLAF